MFDSQQLGHVICTNYIDYNLIIMSFNNNVICTNYIDYNLIILIFKRDYLTINFNPLPCPHYGDPLPLSWGRH